MISTKRLGSFAQACGLIAICSAAAVAQNTTSGAITGTVFDQTNAAIPGAKIVIHNNGNNADLTLTSSGSGFFKAPDLAPGSYTVSITAPGFEQVRSNNVTVEVNLSTEFDQHLSAGGEAQIIEVTSTPPVLNFQDASFGGHLEQSEIESLPINNRRWSTLALLSPGITVDTNGFGLLQFHAISPLLNNVEIDGADDNQAFFSEERGRTRAGYSTSQAMVQEFQINTGVYSAEYGRAVGGVINSVTKQGTNNLHGEAYFYNRKSSRAAFVPLSTITTFNAATNTYVNNPYKPSDNRNELGFQVGGPLIKDKLFFSYAFDMFRRNFPGTAKVNTPTTFFAAPSAATITLLATRLGTTTANATTIYNQQLQNFLTDLGTVPRFGDQEINTPKLDYQLGSKHHVSLLYHRLRWDSPGGVQTQGTNNYGIDTFGTDFVKLDYGLAKLDSQLSSHLTNELRYQYGRELNDEGQQPLSGYSKTNLTSANGNVPEVNLLGSSTGFYFGSPYYSYRVAYPDERKWQIGDTASFVFGRHALKFGEDFVHNYDLQNNLYESNGYYSYSSVVNYISDLVSKTGTCDSGGNSTGTLPCYSSFAQSFGQPILSVTTQDYGVFAQDDWKLSPRLTVNLGVRYDYEKLPAQFAPNSAISQTAHTPSDKNNIAPRVGFAWDPYGLGKTTVRAGYGLYYGRIFNALLLNALENTGAGVAGASPTSQAAYSFNSTTVGAPFLPNVATSIPPALSPTGIPILSSIEYLDPHLQNPYTQQFDMAVQQDLGSNTILSVSYLGSLGRELPNYLNVDLNPASRYTINYTVAPGTDGTCGPVACGTVFPTQVYANRLQTGASTGVYNYSPLLNPNYNGITDVVSNLNSSYHAATVEVTHRGGKYFSYDANYTWSHALDFNQTSATSFTAGANNWFDPNASPRANNNYGNSLFNIPHRVVAWALFNVPGVSKGSALSYLTNGWSIKPIISSQTGFPYSVNTTGTTPNQCSVAGCFEVNSSGLAGSGVTYIPQLGRNVRHYPNTVIADARVEKDFTFAEKYNLQLIGEGFNLPNHQNVTGVNTTGYTITNSIGPTPAATTSRLVYSPAFGTTTSANSNYALGPRQIQISARLVF